MFYFITLSDHLIINYSNSKQCVRELMHNDIEFRPSADRACQLEWIRDVEIPMRQVRGTTIIPAALKSVAPQNNEGKEFKLPGRRSGNRPGNAPIPAGPSPVVKAGEKEVAPIEFIAEDDDEGEACPGTADPKNFKDGWAQLMRNVREEEDDDIEEKMEGEGKKDN